jgi:hypothetical protein
MLTSGSLTGGATGTGRLLGRAWVEQTGSATGCRTSGTGVEMTASEPVLGGGLLFTSAAFHDLNAVPAAHRWRYEHRSAGGLVGVLDGVLTDDRFVSGHSAPFGGPDLARQDPALEDVVGLVDGALAALREAAVRTVEVRGRPAEYSAAEPLLEYALLRAGFRVGVCALNHHLLLSGSDSGDGALARLGRKRARDVRRDLELPYALTEATTEAEIGEAHAVLAANRAAHDRAPGLPADYLARACAAFPGRVRVSVLRFEDRPVAAAVVYRVLDDVDLLTAWGDVPDHGLQRSPMNLLAHLLVQRSAGSGARVLDLGPSSEHDGSANFGLARFKRSVGAVPGTRKVLVASLG